jgi:aspartate/methionine/tyrosine aminotransferase
MWEMLKKFPWIECGKAKGGPFMFPDVSKCGTSDEELAQFLREQGVGVWGGTPWAENPEYGVGHIRLSYCSPRILQKTMTLELEKALTKYEGLNKALISN